MDEQSIIKVLESLGARKIKSGPGRVSSSCPFAPYTHSKGTDNNPSFSIEINPSGPSRFVCGACKKAGKKSISLLYAWKECTGTWRSDLHDIISRQEGGTVSERLKRLGSFDDRRRKLQRSEPSAGWTVAGYEAKFDPLDYQDALKFLPRYAFDRGITVDQAKRWGIGFDQIGQRLFISIFDETGKMVGFSRRAIREDQTPKYLHAENFRRDKYLYGEQFVDHGLRTGVLVEGFMDVLNLERCGWINVLACFGTAVSMAHVEKMKKWFDRVVILPHNDAKPDNPALDPPGLKMAKDYADALRQAGLVVAIGPMIKDKKDPGDWLQLEADKVFDRLKGFIVNGKSSQAPSQARSQEGPPREEAKDSDGYVGKAHSSAWSAQP